MDKKKYILGLDPGTRTGYALFKEEQIITYGEINSSKKDLILAYLFEKINDLILIYKPDICIIESIFVNKLNFKTTLRLCEIRGVLLTCCEINKIPYICYAPSVIKKSICNYGKATKQDIKNTISHMYKIQVKSHNIYDAIAIVKTYLNQLSLIH